MTFRERETGSVPLWRIAGFPVAVVLAAVGGLIAAVWLFALLASSGG